MDGWPHQHVPLGLGLECATRECAHPWIDSYTTRECAHPRTNAHRPELITPHPAVAEVFTNTNACVRGDEDQSYPFPDMSRATTWRFLTWPRPAYPHLVSGSHKSADQGQPSLWWGLVDMPRRHVHHGTTIPKHCYMKHCHRRSAPHLWRGCGRPGCMCGDGDAPQHPHLRAAKLIKHTLDTSKPKAPRCKGGVGTHTLDNKGPRHIS
jgi:hypothetical protein